MEKRPTTASRADWAALICSLLLFVWLLGFVAACGEDLDFPGEFPFTPTADATNEPTETPDDEEA